MYLIEGMKMLRSFMFLLIFAFLSASFFTPPTFAQESPHPRLYTLMSSTGSEEVLEIVDLTTMQLIRTFPISQGNNYSFAVSPNGQRAYVATNFFQNETIYSVTVWDTETGSLIATIPVASPVVDHEGEAIDTVLSKDGSRLYVTVGESIAMIDTATNTVLQTFTPSQTEQQDLMYGIAVSPDGSLIGSVGLNGPGVYILYADTLMLKAYIPIDFVGSQLTDIVFASSELAFAADQSRIFQIDLTNNTQIVDGTIETGAGGGPEWNQISYSQFTGKTYQAQPQGQETPEPRIVIADPETGNLSSAIDGKYPYIANLSPNGRMLYVAESSEDSSFPQSLARYDTVNDLMTSDLYSFSNSSSFVVDMHVWSPEIIVNPISVSPNLLEVNDNVSTTASFSDLSSISNSTYTAIWDWGDNSTSAGVVSQQDNSGSVSGSHIYSIAGVYTITLTVNGTNDHSGQATYQYVVVYDPNGGFVTGAGLIDSPAGAFAANPTISGKANFGFTSKYQNGAGVPTGNTKFRFHLGGLDFQSTSYEWLVISGPKAQYKGEGTIGGSSAAYKFLLTATDGQIAGGGGSDKFRIKIRDQNTNHVVYDNMIGQPDNSDPSTLVTAGNIVIQN